MTGFHCSLQSSVLWQPAPDLRIPDMRLSQLQARQVSSTSPWVDPGNLFLKCHKVISHTVVWHQPFIHWPSCFYSGRGKHETKGSLRGWGSWVWSSHWNKPLLLLAWFKSYVYHVARGQGTWSVLSFHVLATLQEWRSHAWANGFT